MDDPRVTRGVERQAVLRRRMLDQGARHLGWKIGFGAPAAMKRLRLDRPLVGFLTDRTLLPDGSAAPVAASIHPVAEAEIALHLGSDVPPDAAPARIRAAVAALGPAIELADVSPPPAADTVEDVLAGDIFHRYVILGPTMPPIGDRLVDGLTAEVFVGDERIDVPDDLESLTGPLIDMVGLVAGMVAVHGERLTAGDVILPGSIVAPRRIAPGDRVRFVLVPAGTVTVDAV